MTDLPKKPSLIRWERVRPAIILLTVLVLLIIFLLDPFLKWVLVKSGQAVFGARVNIASVKTTFRQSRLSIRGLEVADKSAPMRNLFQWGEAAFDFRSVPLIEKKVVIDEASITGLKFGTPRKTSGALTMEEQRPGFVSKAMTKVWGEVETVSLEKAADVKKEYDPKALMGSLNSLKVAEHAKTELQKAPDDVQKQMTQLNAQARADEFQKRIRALNEGGDKPEALLAKAKEVKKLRDDLQTFRNDVTQTQRGVTEKIHAAQGLVEDVRKAKDEDWKAIRSKMSLPSLDKASMARALFGPTIAQWAERLLNGIHTARQYMPAKPQSPPPPPRGRARIIEFPLAHDLPRFLLVKALVSGEVGLDHPFGFSGTLTGLTTNPPLYGKPATLLLHGEQGKRLFDVKGVIDHTRDTPLESIQASYAGFPLSHLSFGQTGNLAFGIQKGDGRARGAVTIQGDRLHGQAELMGENLSVDPHVDLKSDSAIAQRAAKNITTSLANVKALNVGIGIAGTLESPDFQVDSNIGSVVADALKNAFGAEVAEQEKAVRAELDRQTEGKIKDLQGQAAGLQKVLPQLDAHNKLIDDLLAQLQKQGTGTGSLKNIFGH